MQNTVNLSYKVREDDEDMHEVTLELKRQAHLLEKKNNGMIIVNVYFRV